MQVKLTPTELEADMDQRQEEIGWNTKAKEMWQCEKGIRKNWFIMTSPGRHSNKTWQRHDAIRMKVRKIEGSNEYRLPVWHLIHILWVIIEGRDNVRCSVCVCIVRLQSTKRSKYSSLLLCCRDKRIIIVSRLIEIPSTNFQWFVKIRVLIWYHNVQHFLSYQTS